LLEQPPALRPTWLSDGFSWFRTVKSFMTRRRSKFPSIAVVTLLACVWTSAASAQDAVVPQNPTRGTVKVQSRAFNPFAIGASRISVNRFGVVAFRANPFVVLRPGEVSAKPASASPVSAAATSSSAVASTSVASAAATSTTTEASSTNEGTLGEVGLAVSAVQPPYRPPQRSPWRPPPRPPFLPP
jgi:hypothetical protein